jgi:hypothetical protein
MVLYGFGFGLGLNGLDQARSFRYGFVWVRVRFEWFGSGQGFKGWLQAQVRD